jgi:hypothetical protein
MIVGVVGALASAVFWSSFSPYDRRRSAVVQERDVVSEPSVTEVRR